MNVAVLLLMMLVEVQMQMWGCWWIGCRTFCLSLVPFLIFIIEVFFSCLLIDKNRGIIKITFDYLIKSKNISKSQYPKSILYMIFQHLTSVIRTRDHTLTILDLVKQKINMVHILVPRLQEQLLTFYSGEVAILIFIEKFEHFDDLI